MKFLDVEYSMFIKIGNSIFCFSSKCWISTEGFDRI